MMVLLMGCVTLYLNHEPTAWISPRRARGRARGSVRGTLTPRERSSSPVRRMFYANEMDVYTVGNLTPCIIKMMLKLGGLGVVCRDTRGALCRIA